MGWVGRTSGSLHVRCKLELCLYKDVSVILLLSLIPVLLSYITVESANKKVPVQTAWVHYLPYIFLVKTGIHLMLCIL